MKHWGVVIIMVVLGAVIGGNCIGHRYENSNRVYPPGDYQTYYLPANSHVKGFIKADGNFSAYVIRKSELSKYKRGKEFNPLFSWTYVSRVELDFDVPDETYYLVVKNEENRVMIIHVEFKAK